MTVIVAFCLLLYGADIFGGGESGIDVRITATSLGALVAIWALIVLLARKTLRPSHGAVLLVFLAVGEQFLYAPRERARRYDPFTVPPFVRFLRREQQPFRVMGVDGVLQPNTSSAYGIDDIRSVNAIHLNRYMHFILELVDPTVTEGRFGGEGFKDVRNRFLDLLNVRYILSPDYLDTRFADDKLELVFDKEVKVYQNTSAFPRAWIVHRAEVIKDRRAVLDRLKSEQFDLKRIITVEQDVPLAVSSMGALPPVDDSVAEILDYGPSEVIVSVRMDYEGFLVLGDAWFPGWRVLVDGKESTMYRTDYLIRSVYLPKGHHRVRFVYDPLCFRLGAIISSCSLSVIAGLLIRRRRKKVLEA